MRRPELDTTHRHSFTELMWAAERQKLWVGMRVSENPGSSPIGVLSEWDISKGTGDPVESRKVHAPITHVHRISANVVLAEVCSAFFPHIDIVVIMKTLQVDDPDMQFILHDWRTPRAAHKFGYDHSRWVGTHMRGES